MLQYLWVVCSYGKLHFVSIFNTGLVFFRVTNATSLALHKHD